MRLWHYKLIPFLPKSQLIAQWRELNSIYKKQDKHILINYIYGYDKKELMAYSWLVMKEMDNRGFKINSYDNFREYFSFCASDTYFATRFLDHYPCFGGKEVTIRPFFFHHTNRYLKQCFYNLQEKYDRGQKDFSKEQYEKLEEFVMNLTKGTEQ